MSPACRLGTRGSALARAQTRLVADRLEAAGWQVEIVPVRTSGDLAGGRPSLPLARGAFVRELESALLERRIDLAVHSAKDMPTEDTPGVLVRALPRRGDARDAVVTRNGQGLDVLPDGARVGTESPRRRAFLLSERPDLEIVAIRGNVDTRLARLDEGRCEALVLACAGLERLGLAGRVGEIMDTERMVPAVGQGALAVQARADDPVGEAVAFLDDLPTRRAVTAERTFLAAMGGGCRAPFAAHARLEGDELVARGAALEPEGREILRQTVRGRPEDAELLGRQLARELLDMGAAALAGNGIR